MEKTKENKMKIEEIKKVNDSISNEDMEKKLDELIAELAVVSKMFDSLFILRKNGTGGHEKRIAKLQLNAMINIFASVSNITS